MTAARVVVDACILVKSGVSDIVFDLALSGLVALHWTPEIGEEVVRNLIKRARGRAERARAQAGAAPLAFSERHYKQWEEAARNRLAIFEETSSEWRIPGWGSNDAAALRRELLLDEATRAANQATPRRRGQKTLRVDSKDRHVALAAICLSAAFPNDEVWLLTENVDDLPPEILTNCQVWVCHQSLFLETLHASNPSDVQQALEKTIDDKKRPPMTRGDMVDRLRDPAHVGSDTVADAMKQAWGQ